MLQWARIVCSKPRGKNKVNMTIHAHKWILMGCLAVPSLWGQIHGDISGTVLDPSGAVVPAARLVLTSQDTGEKRSQKADSEGRFGFHQLKIGGYQIHAEATGFREVVATATVRSGETAVISLALEVGPVQESISVGSATPAIDTGKAQVQTSLGAREVGLLPVQRNPLLFSLTSPGIAPVTADNPFLTSGSYNANGGRGRADNITIDNITSTDVVATGNAGAQMGPLNYEQIQEVKLITSNFDAEFGRNGSSQLQFITKSGTNDWHGDGYEFLRNSAMNARDFFDTTGHATVTRYNDFGFTLGGPIRKNKTQFFASFDDNPLRGAGTVRIAQVPTPAMIAQVIDPTSQKLLALYNLPVSPNGQAAQSGPNWQNAYQGSMRIDHQFSESDTLTGRYAQYYQEGANPGTVFATSSIAGFGANYVNRPQNANLTETHLFSNSVVNEFRFGFGRVSPFFVGEFAPGGPLVAFNNGATSNLGESNSYPQGRAENTFQFGDSLAWIMGAHNLKAGADVYRYQVNSMADSSVRGVYIFNTWTDFANGNPATYTQKFGSTDRGHRVTNSAYYLQDDWRIRRDLTVNVGLRMEVAGGVSEVNGLISNLNLNCTSPIAAAGTGPLGCFTTGQPSNRPNVNWGPRVGFSWNPGNRSDTVIRAGYGIAYDFIFMNPILNQRSLPPFIYTASLSGGFTGANSWANLVAGTALVQASGEASTGVFNPTARNFGILSPIIDTNLQNPQTQQWNFGIEREIGHGIVLKASYVGSKSNYLERTRPINLIMNPPAPATSPADEAARLAQFKAAVVAGSTGVSTPSDRFDPRFNDVNMLDSSANSNYHSFQFLAQRTFAHGYFLQVAYTFSKSIDDVSDAQGVLINDSSNQQNPLNNRDNRAVSQFDIPQRLVVTHVWDLPLGRNLHNPLLHTLATGWSLAGISSYRSGFPVTLDAGARFGIQPIALTGVTGGVMRVDAAGPFSFNPEPAGSAGSPAGLNKNTQPISLYAASIGLSQPLLGNFGTLGRNTLRLNPAPDFDWSVFKNTSLGERVKLELRGEFYNLFNNVVFQDVTRNLTSTAFGQYSTVAFDSRRVQIGARVQF